MGHDTSELTTAARGLLAGLAGTVAITAAVKTTPKLLRRLDIEPPLDERAEDAPTERLIELVLGYAGVDPVPERVKIIGGQVFHWGYGAIWGAFYALLQRRI